MRIQGALLALLLTFFPLRLLADYKPEFKLSINVSEETSWGKAAKRFADAVRYQTGGRIRIRNYFDGKLFKGEQTSEFQLLQQGIADFAVGSTINWSPQVRELNLFALPFMFSSFRQVDAVQAGDPGILIFKMIEQKGVVPLAWGENGFREVTNASRPIRRPEDLQALKIRTVGVPIFLEIFQALGANPINMNWDDAQTAFWDNSVDGQENPVALIIPYRLYIVHRYITLWHYAIDPLIMGVSAKTWAVLSPEDRVVIQRAAEAVMAEQKKEAREGLEETMPLADMLQKIYLMEVVHLSHAEVQAFREKTRHVYARWAEAIGAELVQRAESLVANAK